MKQLKQIGVGLAFAFLTGCGSSDIMLYEQNAAAYFESSAFSYSFLENPAETSHVVKIPVNISGLQVDYDRKFVVARPEKDTITTAEEDQYRIGEGVVKANEYSGLVEVELLRDKRLDDSVYTLALEIRPNEDFREVRLNKTTLQLSFTNKVIQPANWGWLKWYFGEPFSTRWWTFICEATGQTSLPYFPTNPDTETWWMDVDMIIAYQTIVRLALEEYNAKHPDAPLTHDDGKYAGQKVEMPN